MLKISFTNAEVSDHGYGLEVNGNLTTIYTSNLSPEELRSELGDRIASRVLGSSQVVEITSGDRRGIING